MLVDFGYIWKEARDYSGSIRFERGPRRTAQNGGDGRNDEGAKAIAGCSFERYDMRPRRVFHRKPAMQELVRFEIFTGEPS